MYLELSNQLIQAIENNEFVAGELLPSERTLAEQHGMSRTTVRLALDDLEKKGYISRQHGKGSIVLDVNHHSINLGTMFSFTDEMKRLGKKPINTLLDYEIVDRTKELANIFKGASQSFIKIIRLRSAGEKPMMYEETYIPRDKFHAFTKKDIEERSLYAIFKEDYQEIIKLAREEFSAGIALAKEADLLETEENSAVLIVYRTTLNQRNEIIEYTISKVRPDNFNYRTVHYNPYFIDE